MELINFLVFTLKVLALIFLILVLFNVIVDGLIIAPIQRWILKSKQIKLFDAVKDSIEQDKKEEEIEK